MKANAIAVLLFFLILSNAASAQPAYCSNVKIESGNIVVGGQPFFPIGFWGWYNYPEINMAEAGYPEYFNAIMGDGPYLFEYIESSASQGKVKMFSQSALADGTLNPGRLAAYHENSNVIGWEMKSEPDRFAYFDSALGKWVYKTVEANVESASDAIRDNDECKRPVVITPTITGAKGQYLQDHAQYIDIVMVQAAYRTPVLDLKGCGENVKTAVGSIGNKSNALIMRIEGFQPNRIRRYFREPTLEEMRLQAYDAIINGAKGVLMYSFSKGVSSLTNEETARKMFAAYYDLRDSPKQFEKIKEFALDLKKNENIFLSPFNSTASVSMPDGINCSVWNVNEDQRMADYVICANVAEETSPYFKYTAGDPTLHIKAHLINNTIGETFSPLECNDGIDNDLDDLMDTADPDCSSKEDDLEGPEFRRITIALSTSTLYIAAITNGLTFNNAAVNKFDLNFVEVPSGGAHFKYAVYSDGMRGYVNPNKEYDPHFDLSRDLAPDTKIIEGTACVDSAGVKEFDLPNEIELEHTRMYFLVIHMQTPNVKMGGKDVRTGALSLEGNAEFLNLTEQAPVLRKGKTMAGELRFSGITANKYCVQKSMGTGLEMTIGAPPL